MVTAAQTPGAYSAEKERVRKWQRTRSESGRDIGPLPPVVNPRRKRRARTDLAFFAMEYQPDTYALPFSADHHRLIDAIDRVIRTGGLKAMSMPRGCGKTTLCETACLWGVLYGYRQFIALIGATEAHAEEMLGSIKMEFATNDRLLDDFPEACFPIRSLEGINNRASGQLYRGEATRIHWTAKEIVLPTIADSRASGAIIKVAGLTGRIRGMKFKRPDGSSVRPDLVIPDDPQTDDSARSPAQSAVREGIVSGAILGLAAPGQKIAAIMPCTVIQKGDMADRMLDRNLHPAWQGERTKMVYAWPTDDKLWAEYAEILKEELKADRTGAAATQFYAKNREAMDEGAVVSWKERFNADELSAIQHAWNLRLRSESAFFAEYQNEPLVEARADDDSLTADAIADRINRLGRHIVPAWADILTAFIDVQKTLLYYVVCAWRSTDFTGAVIDYGCWPDQQRAYYTLGDAKRTIQLAFPRMGIEGQWDASLEALATEVLGREYPRDGGGNMKVDRCLVDASYGDSTDSVYEFCRRSVHSSILTPSHGRYVGAASRPMAEYQRKPGERYGDHWIHRPTNNRPVRHISYDANHWKSFTAARLTTAMGDKGALTLYGDRPQAHRMFADQCVAEVRIRVEARGRTVDEWKIRPERSDNHVWDGLVGCAVGASLQGATIRPADPKSTPKRGRFRVKYMN